jgi:hypothetical protein
MESLKFDEVAGAQQQDDPTRDIYASLAHDQGLLDRLTWRVARQDGRGCWGWGAQAADWQRWVLAPPVGL